VGSWVSQIVEERAEGLNEGWGRIVAGGGFSDLVVEER
jgi:hypothetical protein